MSKSMANKQAAADKQNNKKKEKKMSKKIKSYILKKGSVVNVIRFNNSKKLNGGYENVTKSTAKENVGFKHSDLVAKKTCTYCDGVSYIFDSYLLVPLEIKEQDLIMTQLSISEYNQNNPSNSCFDLWHEAICDAA